MRRWSISARALILIPSITYAAGSPRPAEVSRYASAEASRDAPPRIHVGEAALRAAVSVYPVPEYPAASLKAKHEGRVVIEVVVAPATRTSPLARVQSTKVIESPDEDMTRSVLAALGEARYMPFFSKEGSVTEASGRVAWEFHITPDGPTVIDPYATAHSTGDPSADDLQIVQRAREILSSEAAWNRADNRQCPPNRKIFSLYCALELATQEVTGSFEHRGSVLEDARAVIDELAPHADYDHRLMGYNNDPSTTFADIQKLLRLTEERVRRRTNR